MRATSRMPAAKRRDLRGRLGPHERQGGERREGEVEDEHRAADRER